MGYSNINATPNYQLQGFGQSGMRTISTSQAYVEGEYYRVLVATQDSTISATSVIGDDITDLQVYAGTTIYGLFTAVSVSVGEVTAYLAGATDIESVWSYINTYGLNNGAIIEAADCAKDAIEPLLDKYYAQASLVLVPSLYKTSVVYAERPLDANGQLTFTRASEATRVGPDGYVEKVRTNLALYSQEFDNAYWLKTNSTITANSATAPDGTLTADKVVENALLGEHGVARVGAMTAAGVYALSVFVKAAERTRIAIGNSSAGNYAIFDLSLGTVVQASSGTVTNGKISSIDANGYYRVSCTITVAAPASASITLVSTGTTILYLGDGTSGLFLWGAQLETGDIATDYIPTTTTAVSVGPVSNLPRLNYPINADGSVGCPSLLLEPQRTNLCLWSENFDNAAWSKVRCAATANTTTSPDGYVNADTLTSTDPLESYVQTNATPTASQVAFSFFAKKNNINFVHSLAWDNSANGARQWFDIENGTVGSSIVFGTGYSVASASIVDYGNGWYRCITIYNVTSGILNGFRVSLSTVNAGVDSPIGSAQYLWGVQVEAGAYATSYIPTLSASVTRVADAASKTGISSLIGQTEGTFFLDFVFQDNDTSVAGIFSLSDGTTSNRIYIGRLTNRLLRSVVSNSGVTVAEIATATDMVVGQRYKAAIAYKSNDFAFYVNGTLIGTDTSGAVPATSQIQNNSGGGASPMFNPINQTLLFKTRLTNSQLQELTSL
jgi:hypothetical protein